MSLGCSIDLHALLGWFSIKLYFTKLSCQCQSTLGAKNKYYIKRCSLKSTFLRARAAAPDNFKREVNMVRMKEIKIQNIILI